MPIQMNLWSLTLYPGEAIPIFVRRDFQITNAALDEELDDENARTSVSVTHFPVPLHPVDSDDEDFDSDEFDSDEMADLDEDEEDDEEEIAAKVVKAGGKVVGAEVDEEEEEDEESDDEDDSDLDFDEMAEQETNVLCTLTGGKIEQAVLNLTFVSGDVVRFQTTGPNVIHLMGNYIYQGGDSDDEDSDDEDYDLDDYSDELDSEDEFSVEEFDEADVAVAPKGKIELIEDVPKAVPAKADKKRKAVDEAEASPAKADGELSKSQKKKLGKKARLDGAADEKPEAAPAKQSKKRTLPSGLVIEDVKTGNGPVAKAGKRLGMRYIGKLTNGKQFDANTGGKPFSFVLGRGEVIGGWEQGLAGMAVGGERRLTVPPKLAYGSQKIPGIPPNSTLVFDVKLVSVN